MTIYFTKTFEAITTSYDPFRTGVEVYLRNSGITASSIKDNGDFVDIICWTGYTTIYNVPKDCYCIVTHDGSVWKKHDSTLILVEMDEDENEKIICRIEESKNKPLNVSFLGRELSKLELQELFNILYEKRT